MNDESSASPASRRLRNFSSLRAEQTANNEIAAFSAAETGREWGTPRQQTNTCHAETGNAIAHDDAMSPSRLDQ
jgi:hypothetical protein